MNETNEPRGKVLIKRYKRNYHIADSSLITEEMILRHWELEKSLTRMLLETIPETRWEVFSECYTKLYGELEWLNEAVGTSVKVEPRNRYRDWIAFIGKAPKNIYEIGSGKGELIGCLTNEGHICKGSEITKERGDRWVDEGTNISWRISDGIHLDWFEPAGSYDIVISNQVVEHFHPADILSHFKGVYSILKPAGMYIIATPHEYLGPHDISKVFNYTEPRGMHLKEYTYHEIQMELKKSGFAHIYSVFRLPSLSGRIFKARASKKYFTYLLCMEKALSLIPSQRLRFIAAKLLQLMFFRTIFVVAQK